MSIKFLCTNCQKVLSVKDELAGKKGKCPHCATVVTVPTPTKAPAAPAAIRLAPKPAPPPPAPAAVLPPPPDDLDALADALAAAALVDEPKADATAPAPTTIDFECPMCGEALHMPLELAGKREPCSHCKRVIKVPEPAQKDPTNWRNVDNSLPSGARRPEEKAPEGAWGSAAGAATVSRAALQDAGAIPDAKALLTVRQRVIRYAIWAGIGVFIVVIATLGYLKKAEVREAKSLDGALTYAASDPGKAELGRDGRAAVHRLAGEYYLRKRDADGTKNAHEQFGKSLGLLGPAADAGAERDALLQDLVLAEVALGGPSRDVDVGLKVNWDDVQKELHAALRDMRFGEARLEALRGVARRLADAGQAERAPALVSSLYPSANGERAEALGAVGLELRAAHVAALPEKIADQLQAMYAVEKDRPALAPAATALLVALGREPPEPGKRRSPWEVEDKTNNPLGRAEGLARAGKWAEARQTADDVPTAEGQLRAYVALAAAALDDKAGGAADAATAIQKAPAGVKTPWLLLRLARIGRRAGVAPDALRSVADIVSDPALRGRTQLAVLQAQLALTKQAADVKLLDGVDAATLSARLAHEEWARHNSRYGSSMASMFKDWDAANRAFGLLGVALGSQGDE